LSRSLDDVAHVVLGGRGLGLFESGVRQVL